MTARSTWKAAERRVGAALGGKRIPVTGLDRDGADVITPIAHVQVKHRKGIGGYLRTWLWGIIRDAHPHGKVGILVVSTPGQPTTEALVVMRLDQFTELYGPVLSVPTTYPPAGLPG